MDNPVAMQEHNGTDERLHENMAVAHLEPPLAERDYGLDNDA